MLIILGVIVALVIALAFYNNNKSSDDQSLNDEVWNAAMVNGQADAANKVIEYGDYFCEYCTKFHEQVSSQKFIDTYLKTGKVKVETRPVTLLAGPHSPNAEQGAEAAFCSADQKKYEEYSNHIIPRIKKDFFDKGIGVKSVNGRMLAEPQPIEKLPQQYFNDSAQAAKMDIPAFEDCMKTEKFKDEIAQNTQKSLQAGVQGLPHIVVNGHVSSGFAGGWDNFELMLKAGGIQE